MLDSYLSQQKDLSCVVVCCVENGGFGRGRQTQLFGFCDTIFTRSQAENSLSSLLREPGSVWVANIFSMLKPRLKDSL